MNHLKLEDLGKRIAKLRKERHMTLKQLSDATGISVGFLSKVENGVCNPSISNVQKICYAMQVTVNELTALKKEDELLSTILKHESYVLRKESRCLIYGFGDTFRLETVFEGTPGFKVNIMTLTAGNSEQSHCIQAYDNFAIIAKGSMRIDLDDGTHFILCEGDCVMIRAKQQHSITNLSDDTCISYWIEIKDPQNLS